MAGLRVGVAPQEVGKAGKWEVLCKAEKRGVNTNNDNRIFRRVFLGDGSIAQGIE